MYVLEAPVITIILYRLSIAHMLLKVLGGRIKGLVLDHDQVIAAWINKEKVQKPTVVFITVLVRIAAR